MAKPIMIADILDMVSSTSDIIRPKCLIKEGVLFYSEKKETTRIVSVILCH